MEADARGAGAALTHHPLRPMQGPPGKVVGALIPRSSDGRGPPANLPILSVVTRGRLGGGPSPSALAGYHQGAGEGAALSFLSLAPARTISGSSCFGG